MRTAIFCAAAISVALVWTDSVVANSMRSTGTSINRTLKADREMATQPGFSQPAFSPVASSRKSKLAPQAEGLVVPDGCETGVSPLAKAVGAPAALCVS